MATAIPASFTGNYIDDLVTEKVPVVDGVATVTVVPFDAPDSVVSFNVDGQTTITFKGQTGKGDDFVNSLKTLQPNVDRVFASIQDGHCTSFQFPPPTPAIGFSGKFVDYRFLGPALQVYHPSNQVVLIQIKSQENGKESQETGKTRTFAVTEKYTSIVINGQGGKKPTDVLKLKSGDLVSVQIDFGICTKLQCNPPNAAGPIE
jgi:hypothetical protein